MFQKCAETHLNHNRHPDVLGESEPGNPLTGHNCGASGGVLLHVKEALEFRRADLAHGVHGNLAFSVSAGNQDWGPGAGLGVGGLVIISNKGCEHTL